jgi:histidinol-phosphatase (PHP family)
VERVRQQFPQLSIKLALEVDYLPGQEDWIRTLASRHPWDYFIGSVHYVSETWALDSPFQLSEWKKRDPFEVWRNYFDRLARAATSGLFDIIGHADLCKKFAFYPKQDCTPLYLHFVEAAAKSGVALELNTAGLRKDCKEIYPNHRLLNLAKQAGVPITFGSDAHAPDHVGMDFAAALALARSVGYGSWIRFTHRKPEVVPF